MNSNIVEAFLDQERAISDWIHEKQEKAGQPSLYFSTDIRDAGFKVSAVDGNLFPAGFNNLNSVSKGYAAIFFDRYIKCFYPKKKKILLFVEAITQNKFYLENVHTLKEILQQSSFEVLIASDLQSRGFHEKCITKKIENFTLQIYNLHYLDTKGIENLFDLIILNNDLTRGCPEILSTTSIPIIPSIYAGWTHRKKSRYFQIYQQLIQEFTQFINLDPWLLSCLHTVSSDINIHEEKDQKTLYNLSVDLYQKIQVKYDQHNIKEKPFLFLKDDIGTFGLGLLKIESPEDILTLNRKKKNKLYKGKDSMLVSNYLIQEGVPTIHSLNESPAEVCLYQVSGSYVGSFFRYHTEKSSRDNLNSKGAQFKSVTHQKKDTTFIESNNTHIYSQLSEIIQIASLIEIQQNSMATRT